MKKTEKIFNVQTGEETIIERDETPSEKLIRENWEKQIANDAVIAQANAEAKSALLEKLGISEDEARLLLN
jgi:hypothetical protein